MSSRSASLAERGLCSPPSWLPTNVHYEVMMGSVAYGVSDDASDIDLYGFAIPPKDVVFPHLQGEIFGFGRQVKRFESWQQHHVADKQHGKSYDLAIYNIVTFFNLAMENNPNMLDALFVPERCILHITAVGTMAREKRRIFLHKGAWPKFKGYAYSQLHKMSGQKREGKRAELFAKFGFDVKFAYHVVRLLYEGEMILAEGDLDLERNREHLKSIRRGEVTEADVRAWAAEKEKSLERAYEDSKLPWGPDEAAIKALLLSCLEHHYGDLSAVVGGDDALRQALREIEAVTDRVRRLVHG